MAKSVYIGVGGKARKVKNLYIGVGGKARKVKKAYIGVGGKAQLCYTSALPPATMSLWSGESNINISDVTYANGYYVACGSYYDGTKYYARIAYTTSLDGSWTIKNIWEGTTSQEGAYSIAYANGYWVVGGASRSSNTYYGRIAYTTSLNGTWELVNMWEGSSTNNEIHCVIYANGYWVVGGVQQDRSGVSYEAQIAYSTSLSGTWNTDYLWSATSSNNACVTDIAYANGYFVACGQYRNSRNSFGVLAYTSDITSNWEVDREFMVGDYATCVEYVNGYWVIGFQRYSTLYYAQTPEETWTRLEIGPDNQQNRIRDITYADGYWVASGENYKNNTYTGAIYYTTDFTGSWTLKDLWGSENYRTQTCPINGIVYGDGYWLAGGVLYLNDDDSYSAQISYSPSIEEFKHI